MVGVFEESNVPAGDKRRPTGIAGLDFQLGGGFPSGTSIVISGTPLSGVEVMARQFWEAGNAEGSYLMMDAPPEEGMTALSRSADPDSLVQQMKGEWIVIDSLSTIIIEQGIDEAVSMLHDRISHILKSGANVLFILYAAIHTPVEITRVMRAADIYISMEEEKHGNEIERRLSIHKIRGIAVPSRIFPYDIGAKEIELSTTARVV